MNKINYIFKQMFVLTKKHKVRILVPLLIILSVLAILVYYVGPAVIVSFIYAGI